MIVSKTCKIGYTVLAFWLLACFTISAAKADIYMYVDAKGVMHFTNTPTSKSYQIYMRETKKRSEVLTDNKSYDDVIHEAAKRNGISSSLIKALIHVESCFNAKAVSPKGAMGLMQIMPGNLKFLNVDDPFDPWENIMGGTTYLRSMLERFQGDLRLALAAYNAGPVAVEKYNDIPPFPETQDYVQKVIKFFRLYKKG
jgi:soluble lytic murein transglycosylase-like protein